MTFSHHRVKTQIRKVERMERKYAKWALAVAKEDHEFRREYYEEAKEVRAELGGATFVQCRDWARFGDAIGPSAR
jgi:hypothetical protein